MDKFICGVTCRYDEKVNILQKTVAEVGGYVATATWRATDDGTKGVSHAMDHKVRGSIVRGRKGKAYSVGIDQCARRRRRNDKIDGVDIVQVDKVH